PSRAVFAAALGALNVSSGPTRSISDRARKGDERRDRESDHLHGTLVQDCWRECSGRPGSVPARRRRELINQMPSPKIDLGGSCRDQLDTLRSFAHSLAAYSARCPAEAVMLLDRVMDNRSTLLVRKQGSIVPR